MGGHHRRSQPAPRRTEQERAASEALERMRDTGIRLDRNGRFWHEHQEISHPGMRRAFLRWIDRLQDGRWVLRLDAERFVYLEVEDTPLLVVAARWQGDRAYVATNDSTEQELRYDSLQVGASDALYCTVRDRLPARITTQAYYVLAERFQELPGDRFALQAAGGSHEIAITS